MPYYEAQLSLMKQHLTNLRQIPLPSSHTYQQTTTTSSRTNTGSKATRVSNVEYTSDEYRKIRFTYYDAGDAIQVFNSLWYPNPKLGNIPLLGVDLLAFGRKKYLVAVEYQPVAKYGLLHDQDLEEEETNGSGNGRDSGTIQTKKRWMEITSDLTSQLDPFEFGHGQKWQERIQPIYDQLPSELKGTKTERFFEGTDFFSDVMLFGRLERHQEPLVYQGGDLWKAFHSYTESHIDLCQSQQAHLTSLGYNVLGETRRETNNPKMEDSKESNTDILDLVQDLVIKGQKDHDVYMASRDPAHALFAKNFGSDWADTFLYDFLFDLAHKESTNDE